METPKVDADIKLRIEREIAASPEKVFAAWTQAEALSRWFAPTEDHTVKVLRADVRPGGGYRIEMHHVNGAVHVAQGSYREVTPPSRLVFTWSWAEHPDQAETLVTVVLQPSGKGTRLVLVHERFADAKDRDGHAHGWEGCFDRLQKTLAA